MSENKCGLCNIPDYIVYESINEVYRAIEKKSGWKCLRTSVDYLTFLITLCMNQ